MNMPANEGDLSANPEDLFPDVAAKLTERLKNPDIWPEFEAKDVVFGRIMAQIRGSIPSKSSGKE